MHILTQRICDRFGQFSVATGVARKKIAVQTEQIMPDLHLATTASPSADANGWDP
jgi:hypothetical protein